MHLDRRLIGWGLIFILVGAVPLAVNAGLLDRDLVGRWPELWPLLIVAIGISLLLTRTPGAWAGSLSVALVVGIMGGGLVATGIGEIGNIGCGGGAAQAFNTQGGALADGGRMDLEFDCGTLTVGTAPGGSWTLSGRDGDGRAPVVSTQADGVSIKPINEPGAFMRRGKVEWALTLPQDPTLNVGVTLNAGSGTIDLSQARIASFNGTVNAGSLSARLGPAAASNAVNMTVNAGTATVASGATSGTFNLSLNAGSLSVCVPQGSPLRVQWSGTLASHNFSSLGLVKTDDHSWTTAGFNAGQAHIELDVSANAGSFDLSFGGGCSAS